MDENTRTAALALLNGVMGTVSGIAKVTVEMADTFAPGNTPPPDDAGLEPRAPIPEAGGDVVRQNDPPTAASVKSNSQMDVLNAMLGKNKKP